jgi:phosphoglucosamine mutase
MSRLFGTDGVRGRANFYPMDAMTAYRIGAAVAHLLGRDRETPKVLIGRDTRRSGAMLEGALLAGICAAGGEAVLTGVIRRPAGLSDTHNRVRRRGGHQRQPHPFVDNGIKIFAHDGYKLPDAKEDEIAPGSGRVRRETGRRAPSGGQARVFKGAKERYVESLLESFPRAWILRGLSVVLDCAPVRRPNRPEVFRRLDPPCTSSQFPDGTNINRGFGSLHPDQLAAAVTERKADLGGPSTATRPGHFHRPLGQRGGRRYDHGHLRQGSEGTRLAQGNTWSPR